MLITRKESSSKSVQVDKILILVPWVVSSITEFLIEMEPTSVV